MATFGFNSAAQVVKARELGNLPTEFNNIIQYYNCIKRSMIEFHCENLWDNNSVSGMGRLPTAYYGAAPDDAE